MERCKYCGEPLTERTKFCPNCGRPVEPAAVEETEFVLEEPEDNSPEEEIQEAEYILEEPEEASAEQSPRVDHVTVTPEPPKAPPKQEPAAPRPSAQPKAQTPPPRAPEKKKASKLSVWAFICSLTLVASFLGIILAIVDLAKGNKQTKHGLSKAALVIGGVFLLLAWVGNTFLKSGLLESKEETLAEISAAGQEAVASGNRVVSIACGRGFLVGLRNNGRVALSKDAGWYQTEFLNVPDWTQITAIDVDADGQYILGLRFDGTVVASVPARYGTFATADMLEKQFQECGPCTSIEAGTRTCFGVREDGTVFVAFFDRESEEDWDSGKIEKVRQWKDIVRVEQIDSDVYGWKKDGSIVSTNEEAARRLKSHKKVMSLGGPFAEAALHANGTVAPLWGDTDNPRFQPVPDWYGSELTQWKGVEKLLVFTNRAFGLKKDGTVVSAYLPNVYNAALHVTIHGGNDRGECEVAAWTDIVDICSFIHTTVGLKQDGSLVFAGDSSWFDPAQWNQPASTVGASSAFTINSEKFGLSVKLSDPGWHYWDTSDGLYFVRNSDGENITSRILLTSERTKDLPEEIRTPEAVIAAYLQYQFGLTEVSSFAPITVNGYAGRCLEQSVNEDGVTITLNAVAWSVGERIYFALLGDASGYPDAQRVFRELLDTFQPI